MFMYTALFPLQYHLLTEPVLAPLPRNLSITHESRRLPSPSNCCYNDEFAVRYNFLFHGER
jgi:hypothetical protein